MNKSKLKRVILIVLISVLYAFLMRAIFGRENLFTVMSVTFILLVPVGIGALTIALSNIEDVKRFNYRFFVPWIPIIVFFGLTLLFKIEGWACWMMILPVFLIASSIGGLIAGYYKLKNNKNEKLFLSALTVLPLLVSPIEQLVGAIPGKYEVYTYIDINANKSKIWNNVTRVKAIDKLEDKGWFTNALGFPRPIEAELNYEGVGGFRKAIFDKGLVFNETVTDYIPEQKMAFTIKANPYDIPSTTMDKHILVGGQYFDVLNGMYIMQQLNDKTYRLHLYSHFKLSTTFNFYASWWAGWIMKDIQNNILQVIKQRSELK